MYKIIMAPTDGSDAELPALDVAVSLARRFDAELRLVRVETPPVVVDPHSGPGVLEQTEESLLEARRVREKKLEELAADLRKRSASGITSSLESGRVEQTLRDYADRAGVDLIVMSSHARGGLKRMNLGSVTDYLIRNTEIPTLVVRPSHPPGDRIAPFERIIVPLDGSPLAEQIVPHVKALTAGSSANVNLVRVLRPVTYSQQQIMQPGLPWWDDAVAEAESYLDRIARLFNDTELSVTKEVLMGDDVAAAILECGARAGADLLAIATNGIGGLKRLMFGSIADEITRRSSTSVLVFHPRESGG
jgi:nucleotide-binding universal stress UspA family protein